jgi:hypothetical protein
VEFYSAKKKNEILPFTSKWMGLENITFREVSQAQKAENHMFSLICRILIKNKCRNVIAHGTHTKG